MSKKLFHFAKKIIRKELGMDPKSIGRAAVEQAVILRARKLKMTLEAYESFIRTHSDERQAFCQFIVVSESWFGREMEAIESCLSHIATRKQKLHILSAPCARGEEGISALIAAFQVGFSLNSILVHGVDISRSAVLQAQIFEFGEYSFRGVPEDFKAKYFYRPGRQLRLQPRFAQSLSFEAANILDRHWTPTAPCYDLILCRNLMIYLRPNVQKALLGRLLSLLSPNGALVVGLAEAGIAASHGYGCRNVIWNHAAASAAKATTLSRGGKLEDSVPAPVKSSASKLSVGVQQKNESVLPPPKTEELLNWLERGENLSELFSVCLEQLEQSPGSPSLHFILAVINCTSGNLNEGRAWLERTLELDQNHDDAKMYFHAFFGDAR